MNKMQLTHKTHQIANANHLPFNTVLTHFFLEAVLLKLCSGETAEHFIFKGGLLLSNMFGISQRTTVDMDFLVKDYSLSEDSVKRLVENAIESKIIPEVTCTVQSLEPIREDNIYGGYRVKLQCNFENIRQMVMIDISAGDPITPGPITYLYNPLYSSNVISITSYNLETILAEKLHAVMTLGIANSRSKDFYDIHFLWQQRNHNLDNKTVIEAIKQTFLYRESPFDKELFILTLHQIKNDQRMKIRWKQYVDRNRFASDIEFEQVILSCNEILELIF